ncbi:MAG: ABC transporter ATP-binding protein [Phycisphaeraceae bacterium]|nr:ABC transporter ATP-binding protein [Phycisphaeraceae bacterium]
MVSADGVVAALRIRGLEFAFPGHAACVQVPSLDLSPGEHVLLAGPSGCGKSTLIHLVAGLLEPARGSIEVAGTPVHSLRGSARDEFRGRAIGMIFQTFNLLPGFTALENLLLAAMATAESPTAVRSRAGQLLRDLGVEAVDRRIERLSVGQQQRVAIARAVVNRPALVLADEPTASLDPENAVRAMDLIQSTCRGAGAALLCTSHDPAMRARFPRVVEAGVFQAPGAVTADAVAPLPVAQGAHA